MSISDWTIVVGGAVALALAAHGVRILLTGRLPAATARAFRSARDAGWYHLLFGLALALVVTGTALAGAVLPTVTSVVAVVLAGVAIVRFRPRHQKPDRGQ